MNEKCDYLDFCFRFHHSQLKSTYYKNDILLHAMKVGKPAKSQGIKYLFYPLYVSWGWFWCRFRRATDGFIVDGQDFCNGSTEDKFQENPSEVYL